MISYASILKNANRPRRFFNSKKQKAEQTKIEKPKPKPRVIKTEWAYITKKQVHKPVQKIVKEEIILPTPKKRKTNWESLVYKKYKDDKDYNDWVDENFEQLEDLYFNFCDIRPGLNEERFYITMYLSRNNIVWR